MRVAVVGTGIAGLVVARGLADTCDLTVYEAEDRVGGHTHTVPVRVDGGTVDVDTGFIVFNRATYPRFVELLEELGVAAQPTEMSFSVRCERANVEYNGTSFDKLFAQRSNLVRPAFWGMLRDVLRFYREAPELLADGEDEGPTLGEYLERGGYGRAFVEQHLLPMASAVWSSRLDDVRRFPARTLARFFHNHGFLQVDDRPQWLVVRGGSHAYVRPLIAPFADRIRLGTRVHGVRRELDGVRVDAADGSERFDRVVLACHSDQALRMLADADPVEASILGAIPYQRNEVVLHTDASVMPRRRRAWASWNFHLADPPSDLPTVTYWMNELQSLPGPTDLFVTLNRSHDIDPGKVLRRFVYHHPIFDTGSVRAQSRHAEIDGRGGVHYCGAYWGYGFHEDGVRSGLTVLQRLREQVLVL